MGVFGRILDQNQRILEAMELRRSGSRSLSRSRSPATSTRQTRSGGSRVEVQLPSRRNPIVIDTDPEVDSDSDMEEFSDDGEEFGGVSPVQAEAGADEEEAGEESEEESGEEESEDEE
jgi:hypothetical protein